MFLLLFTLLPAYHAFLFSLTLNGICLSETLYPDQIVTGWFRPNMILENKQLFLEDLSLLSRHSANIYAHNTTFEFVSSGEGNYNFCFQEMKNNGHVSEAWDAPHYNLIHNLHNHHNQDFPQKVDNVLNDKFAKLVFKTSQMEYALEQIHVDMMKFNAHLVDSVWQLSLILAGGVARVAQMRWLKGTLVRKQLLRAHP